MIFQFTSKKIISLLACISITISCLVIPASAAVTPGQVIEGIGTILTLWDIGKDAYEMWQELNPDKDPSEYPGFNPGGSFSGAGGSRDDAIARYEEYVSGLQSELGTATLIDGGIRVYFNLDPSSLVANGYADVSQLSADTSCLNGSVVFKNKDGTFRVTDIAIVAPFNCNVTFGYDGRYTNAKGEDQGRTSTYTAGSTIGFGGGSSGGWNWFDASSDLYPVTSNFYNVRLYADIYPMEGVDLSSGLSQDISINSRPSSIIGDYGIMGDDGTIVKVEGGSLVNESENLVYSPTTAGEITYTDCVFDYADRSYTLTLEDGSTMKVVYGDENVTIHEGDTVYNVYYFSSDSGSGDGSGNGGEVGDAVSGLLGGLGNILAGLIEGLLKMAAQAVEALGGLIDIFNGLVDMILGFFSGFTGFLGSMFPFLPEETFVILNFGLILLIAAAVIKKLFL